MTACSVVVACLAAGQDHALEDAAGVVSRDDVAPHPRPPLDQPGAGAPLVPLQLAFLARSCRCLDEGLDRARHQGRGHLTPRPSIACPIASLASRPGSVSYAAAAAAASCGSWSDSRQRRLASQALSLDDRSHARFGRVRQAPHDRLPRLAHQWRPGQGSEVLAPALRVDAVDGHALAPQAHQPLADQETGVAQVGAAVRDHAVSTSDAPAASDQEIVVGCGYSRSGVACLPARAARPAQPPTARHAHA